MITSKQRAYLRGLANKLNALFQIGKNDIGDAFVKQIDEALEARELIKISVLENSMTGAREAADFLAEKTGADIVSVIGSKVVLYRESVNKKTIEL